MAAAGANRLSDLPDDLLIRILSFAPVKEAASTTALSRRWRGPLWLETRAINLDSRSYAASSPSRAMTDAGEAYNSFQFHPRRPKKMTVIVTTDSEEYCREFMEVVQSPAPSIHGVEELLLDCEVRRSSLQFKTGFVKVMHTLSLDSLPLDALRILEISGCELKQPRAAFPSLVALRLRLCNMELDELQDMINGAPKLEDLRLESFLFERKSSGHPTHHPVLDLDPDQWRHLHCPSVSVLVTKKCYIDGPRIQIDAPRLRYFRYTEPSQLRYFRQNKVVYFDSSFALKSPARSLERVDLEVPSTAVLPTILNSMCHTRILKLAVCSNPLMGDEAFSMFPNLEQLEIEEMDRRTLCERVSTKAV